jgi:hypothetical protein
MNRVSAQAISNSGSEIREGMGEIQRVADGTHWQLQAREKCETCAQGLVSTSLYVYSGTVVEG